MKRKNREISVFSISALDLFCSAMGVFMILCFVVMETKQKTVELPPDVKVINSLTLVLSLEANFTNYGDKSEWHPIAVGDLELNVKANLPNNKQLEYTPRQPSHEAYTSASYISDSVQGGSDVWLATPVLPGSYEIAYIIYKNHGKNKTVKCNRKRNNGKDFYLEYGQFKVTLRVITPTGTSTIEHIYDADKFLQSNTLIPISKINVDKNGNINKPTQLPLAATQD